VCEVIHRMGGADLKSTLSGNVRIHRLPLLGIRSSIDRLPLTAPCGKSALACFIHEWAVEFDFGELAASS
jgi:hypothetical protein